MPSQKPLGYTPASKQTGALPESMKNEIQPTAQPVKPVPNPLETAPEKQPDPKAAAEYYAYQQNEKARRRREKQNNR